MKKGLKPKKRVYVSIINYLLLGYVIVMMVDYNVLDVDVMRVEGAVGELPVKRIAKGHAVERYSSTDDVTDVLVLVIVVEVLLVSLPALVDAGRIGAMVFAGAWVVSTSVVLTLLSLYLSVYLVHTLLVDGLIYVLAGQWLLSNILIHMRHLSLAVDDTVVHALLADVMLASLLFCGNTVLIYMLTSVHVVVHLLPVGVVVAAWVVLV